MRISGAVAACLVFLAACGDPAPQKSESAQPAAPETKAPAWQIVLPISPLPPLEQQGTVGHEGAKIWYATAGQGSPVVLLHGAFGNAENFGFQVPALIKAGHRVVLIDTRGHGRSTRVPDQPLNYELLASDVIAVLDKLKIDKAAILGWSDGAIQGLIIAMKHPARLTRLFAFGANMDPSGVMEGITEQPTFLAVMDQAAKDYARLSPTPNDFKAFSDAMFTMLTNEPNYTAEDLGKIKGPRIAIADGEHEEAIKPDHTAYLAKSIPGAKLIILSAVSHFALMQKPEEFNAAVVAFLNEP